MTEITAARAPVSPICGGTCSVASEKDGLLLAIERAGSQTALARICGCTQGAISQVMEQVNARLAQFDREMAGIIFGPPLIAASVAAPAIAGFTASTYFGAVESRTGQ